MKVGDYTAKAWVAASYSPSWSCCCRRKHHCGTVLDRSSRRHLPWRKNRLWWSNGKDSYIRVQADRQQCWLGVWWDEMRMFVLCCRVCTREHKVLNTESQKRKVKKLKILQDRRPRKVPTHELRAESYWRAMGHGEKRRSAQKQHIQVERYAAFNKACNPEYQQRYHKKDFCKSRQNWRPNACWTTRKRSSMNGSPSPLLLLCSNKVENPNK